MALYKLLCGVTVMILLTANGCHAIMPECGQEREGQDLDDSLPWQVEMLPSSCLGTLISPLFVLTDISCTADVKSVTGRDFGSIEVLNVTCNSTSMGSLCLLKLDSPVNFTDTTYPICVASDSVFHSGMDGYVATGIFKEVREFVPIVGDKQCDAILPERPMRTICTRRRNEIDEKSCSANTGGALMVKYEDHWTMIGVVNPDPDCPDRSLRSYTAVASYAEWIAEVTDMSQPGFVPYKRPGPDDFISSTSSPSEPPHPPTSSHPNTSRPPHPPTSSHSNTSQPPHPPTSSHSNTSRPPHPPTCIHPKPPRRPTPDPSLCLYPGSDDCRNDFESVFGNGVAIHSSPFILLCVLVLSFFGMNW